jgi:hypothetical protein
MRAICGTAAGRPVGRCGLLALSAFLLSVLVSPFSARADTNALAIVNYTGGIAAFNGAGVNVGQIETAQPTNHVDLANQITVFASAGTTSATNHATEVASVIIGTGALDRGAAPGATLYSFGAGSADANYLTAYWLLATQTVGACKVINMSFGSAPVATTRTSAGGTNYTSYTQTFNPDGSDTDSQTIDNVAATKGTIFVKSAGNNGLAGTNTVTDPGSAFNIIVVGAVSNTAPGATTSVADFSSRGYLANGRSAVDIVAPGADVSLAGISTSVTFTATSVTVISNNVGAPTIYQAGSTFTFLNGAGPTQTPLSRINTNSGTSFAAPLVAGVTADLVQYGNTLPPVTAAAATDPRTIKAILLNSATKLAGWGQGAVAGGTAGLQGVLTGGVNGVTTVLQPLDPNQGAGLLNANGAYLQLAAGKQIATIQQQGPGSIIDETVPLTGWDFNTVKMALTNFYQLSSKAVGTLAVTLDWNRDISTVAGTNFVGGMANMGLSLFTSVDNTYTKTSLVAQSISIVDNVEHLWFTNVPTAYYEFGVSYNQYASQGSPAPGNETYAVAWSFTPVPEPSTLLLAGLGITALWWQLKRRRT